MKKSTMVSGQLRTMVTHAVPKARRDGDRRDPEGRDQGAEQSEPTEAPADDAQRAQEPGPVQVQVVDHRRPRWLLSVSRWGWRGCAPTGRRVFRSAQAQGAGSGSSGVSVPSTSPAVDSQAATYGVLVVGQRLVDELAERDVTLLDADAVGLLGELLADELEVAVALVT